MGILSTRYIFQFAPCLSTSNGAESTAEMAGLRWGNQQIICGIIELHSQWKNVDGSLGFCYPIFRCKEVLKRDTVLYAT